MKSTNINLRLEPELKDRIKKLAAKERRSLSNWIINQLYILVQNPEKQKQ